MKQYPNSRQLRPMLLGALLGAFILSFTGCVNPEKSVSGQPGAYDAYYRSGLTATPSVTESALREKGQLWPYAKPYKEVMEATLNVISQYHGIISLESADSRCTMVVVRARERSQAPENVVRTATFGRFYERWVAVGVWVNPETQETEVAIADVNPSTGRLRQSESTSQTLFSQIQVQLSQATWHEKFVGFSDPQAQTDTTSTPEPRNSKPYQHKELEKKLGDWISRRLQVDLLTVHCPETTAWLEGIVDRLKTASGIVNVPTRVVVVNSQQLNAFALPNGDIFIASGLLDSLDSEDEIAAIVAHELDHLVYHDVINRLKTQKQGEGGAAAARTAMAFADLALAVAGGGGSMATSIVTDIGRAGARQVVERGAHHMEYGLVSGYKADTEVRADTNGMKMLYAANYDPHANVRMLHTLKDMQATAVARNETYQSNLINMEPGLDERIQTLNDAISKLKK